jgi:3-hydroxyacyl-CoA dehydrogenase/enoyl-CoA hydratase/carnithine racemase
MHVSTAVTEFKLQWFDSERAGQLALVTIDNGADYNVPTTFGASALDSLERCLDAIESRSAAGVMFTGKPFIFAAGANLDEFVGVDEAFAREGGRRGHTLFGRVRALAAPSLAAINGICMGGGLELALHCDYRTLSSGARALAFPEVFLSIVPAWGGTQLAPRVIGPARALDLIVHNPLNQNRTLRPKQAFEMGLAHWLFEPIDMMEASRRVLEGIAGGEHKGAAPAPATEEPLEEAIARARAAAEARVHGATRAPELAIELVEFAARGGDLEEGYRREEEALAVLLPSRQAQASVYSFHLTQQRVNRQPGRPSVAARPVRQVTVVGAGLMGAQLGALLLERLEVPLVMKDIDDAVLGSAREHIEDAIQARVERGRLSAGKGNFLKSIVRYSTEDGVSAGSDFVIEAVLERLDLKQKIFSGLEAHVSDRCLFATNTSSLSVTAMAEGLAHPERLVGFHFFNPVRILPLVELARGRSTDDESYSTAFEIASKLGKSAVACADAPAFVVNRLLTRFLAPCLEAAVAGTELAAIDAAIEALGLPMGPFKLVGLVGPRVAQHTAETLHAAFPGRFPLQPRFAEFAAAGHAGVYGFDGAVVEEVAALFRPERPVPWSAEEIRDRAMRAVADEAQRLLDEDVVADARDIDTCMLLGAGWPFFMGGLCMYLDQVGLSRELFGAELVGREAV